MPNTLFATEQYEDRSVTGGKIALATILNENVSATADIARTKILNTAVTEGDGGTISGTISISGGTLILPQGTTLPTVGLVEGQIFWKTDTNQLFVFDGTVFQDAVGTLAQTLVAGNITGGIDIQFSGTDKIAGSLGNSILEFSDIASAVNFLRLINAPTGSGPIIEPVGSDANIDLDIKGKGTGLGIRLHSTGEVSIGTTLKNTSLELRATDVNGDVSLGLLASIENAFLSLQSPNAKESAINFRADPPSPVRWKIGRDGADSDKFKIANSSSFSTGTVFAIDQITGNIGIGTLTPGTALQVVGLTTIGGGIPPNHVILADAVFMNSTNIVIDKLAIFGSDAIVGLEKSPHIVIHNENQTTGNNGIIAWTSDNTTNNEVAYAAIVGIAGARTTNFFPGELAFHTRANLSTSLSERMRIDSNGRVGIGTSAPAISALLELASTTGAFLPTRLTTTQRDALTTVDGMILYNSTLGKLQVRESGIWVSPSVISAHASTHSNGGTDEITAENLGTVSTDTSNVLKPDGVGGLTMADLNHSDLTGIGADDHHNQSHVLATNTALGPDHTITGAAAGQVLRASSATAANFQALGHSDLTGVGIDDHHARDHAATHSNGGVDEVTVENLGTVSTDTSNVLKPNGSGGLTMADLGHGELTGIGTDDHHNQSHVLATTAGLGPDHTTSGLTIGQVLRASGATTAAFAQLQHSDLGGVGTDDHHNQSHVLATNTALGPDHTITGAAAGQVLRASSATAANFQQLVHADLGSVGADDHHNQSHVLATTAGLGPDHTTSGLTIGQVLRASGATAAAFAQLQHSDLGGIGVNDHHNQSHVLADSTGLGSDHTTSGLTIGNVLRASGATAAAFAQLQHSDLGGVGIDDHHARDHAAAHSDSGADEIKVEDLGATETDPTLFLKPDGSGGLVFGADGTVNTVTTTDATVTTIATIAILDNTVVLIKVGITGRRTDSADRAGYLRNAVVFREAAGSATLQGTVDTPLTRESAVGWNVTISASGNNVIITVKGLGAQTINWKSKHNVQEIA